MTPRPTFLFAPGAGAPSTHPWMQRWRLRLQQVGDVQCFDYDYMREARKRPDPLPQLVAAHRRALGEARATTTGPIYLVGKSMGGRIGCHVAVEEEVSGVICLSYPLCGAGDRTKLRDKVLRQLRTPILFVQGTRDPLCPLDLLATVRTEMPAPNLLHIVETGDHSLLVTKRYCKETARTQDDVDDEIRVAIRAFTESPPTAAKR